MKILALMNSYTQGLSGGDVRFMEIMKRMENIDLTITTSSLGKKMCINSGLKTKFFITSNEKSFKNLSATYLQRILKALKFNVKGRGYDIIYSTSDFLPDVIPAFIWKLKNKNIKWVQNIHHLYKNPLKRKGKNFVVNLIGFLSQRISFFFIKKSVNAIITVSPYTKKELINIGFEGNKIKVNYNGIDTNKMKNFISSENKYDCVFLGRLNVSKGIFDLLDIWKIINEKNPNIYLAIIGFGDKKTEDELKDRIKINSLEKNINVLGYLEDKKLFGILKSSKIFVFPSHEEGFGIVVCEAMACGLPVVAWDLPVYREIYTKGMITVSINDVAEFAEKILELLDDKKLCDKISLDAIETASRYDWDEISIKETNLLKNSILEDGGYEEIKN